ncbi:unnamed protein product [Chironomus riparius]|uniref:Uncharacterized protein n=1 Tax=Chironomus riparius TaxID=315576 RepID=A0A9P0NBF5_9DIPT|nr:unnamed protein product [Chironomus riparius]
MRIPIATAVYLITLTFTQIHTQNVICDFENIGNDYICTIIAANISSDTTQLEFLSQHLEGRNDSHVTIVRTNSSFVGRIRIYHPQFTQQFPNLQVIDLQRLRILDFSNNSFEKCDELRKVNLHFNEINFLQDNLFSKCEKLTELIISNNHIHNLTDASFDGLDNLEVLNLNYNLLQALSDNVFRFNRKLKELHLGNPWNLYQHNKRMFEFLRDLEVVDLSDWHIDYSETEALLNGLTKLKEIILHKNYYEYFNMSFFSQFENLTILDLNDNKLGDLIDNSLQNLTNLKEFYIQGNYLEILTENTFTGLDNLEILWLGYNSISSIPSNTFDRLNNLKKLSLVFNKIAILPHGIFENLQNLRSLHLGVNIITDLPSGIFKSLVNLESINIYNNKIETLNSNSFGRHEKLVNFTSSWNKIDEIERKFFDNFPNLELLVINENICVDTIIDDFQNTNISSVFGKCFDNFEYQDTTTISTEVPTTTDGKGNGRIIGFSVLLNILLMTVIFIMQ